MKTIVAVVILIGLSAASAMAQKGKVPPTEALSRVWAIDTFSTDPKSSVRKPSHATGMVGYVVLGISKDGKYCLVEYVANKYEDHAVIRNDVSAKVDPLLTVWEKTLVKPEVVQEAARLAGFGTIDFSKFAASVAGPPPAKSPAARSKEMQP